MQESQRDASQSMMEAMNAAVKAKAEAALKEAGRGKKEWDGGKPTAPATATVVAEGDDDDWWDEKADEAEGNDNLDDYFSEDDEDE